MTVALPEIAEVEQSGRTRGGLLDKALPAPDGWGTGLTMEFYGCGEPILRDKCVNATDEPHPDGPIVFFGVFPIEQGATCSTMGNGDEEAHARSRLEATSEWALGRQFATNQVGIADTKTLDDADVLGTVADADFVAAVSCLEQAAADTGFGSEFVLHAPFRAAAYLKSLRLIDEDGLSPTGAPWILSPGYPGDGTAVRLWATGPVWVGVDEATSTEAVERRQNSRTAFALRAGMVAFNPCINLAIDVTVPACPA